jgi:hypothetical protein
MAYDLRPLTLGELLDRAWNLYRHHLLLFVGILAIPSIAMLIMSIVMQFLQPDMPSPDSTEAVDPAQMIGAFVWMGVGAVILGTVYWISYAIALGATTVAVAALYRGRVPSISASYDGVRGRWGRLAWLILLLFLRIFGVTFLVILVSGVMAALLGFLSPIVGALAGMLMLACALAVFVWMALRYAVCVPPAVLEDRTASRALSRSVGLTSGALGRVLVLMLFTVIVAYAGFALTQGPFMVAAMLAGPESSTAFWLNMAGVIAGSIAGAFTGPLAIIAMAVLYYDLRIRKEGLDLELMIADLRADTPAAAPLPG